MLGKKSKILYLFDKKLYLVNYKEKIANLIAENVMWENGKLLQEGKYNEELITRHLLAKTPIVSDNCIIVDSKKLKQIEKNVEKFKQRHYTSVYNHKQAIVQTDKTMSDIQSVVMETSGKESEMRENQSVKKNSTERFF
ncbi:MAG: hypothetical protein IC227_06340 [Enterococcus lacertideformus]|uniref:Uncharacterized protein n=1 Tax=Enterococcus lacertideformus TaxID=2771493 RepID=A0A931F8N6_9ENTE|nr:hypothetical protein [Enterococcus lacertideformus]